MPDRLESKWQEVLGLVRARIENPVDFQTWFLPMVPVDDGPEGIRVRVPDRFFADWLSDNEYDAVLSDCLEEVYGGPVPLRIVLAGEAVTRDRAAGDAPGGVGAGQGAATPRTDGPMAEGGAPAAPGGEELLPDYVFETFVKGGSNELAYAASRAVADKPGTTYNPLFIYGGVGLGKTHLLHAIGHEILRRSPHMRVRYVSSERYMNDYVDAIRLQELHDFRDSYRSQIDVLLIDDIQFFANKDGTQSEFFHTFNALYGAHKQIVFSSDRFPEEIPKLEERLRSRFQWGLIADIKAPQVETRVAILEKKAEGHGIALPGDVALYIAGRIRSNVRQLEGALTRLAAFARLNAEAVTLQMAKEVLKDFLPDADRPVTVEEIIKLVASHFNIKPGDIKGARRHKAVSHPRQIAMYLSRRHTNHSFPEIGHRFGGRDHSTVMSGVKKVERLLDEEDPVVKKSIEILERQLEQ